MTVFSKVPCYLICEIASYLTVHDVVVCFNMTNKSLYQSLEDVHLFDWHIRERFSTCPKEVIELIYQRQKVSGSYKSQKELMALLTDDLSCKYDLKKCIYNVINVRNTEFVNLLKEMYSLETLDHAVVQSLRMLHNRRLSVFSTSFKFWIFVVSESFKTTRSKMIQLLRAHGETLQSVSLEFQDDFEMVMTAVNQNGANLQFASSRLQDNFQISLCAVQNHFSAGVFCSLRLLNNPNFIMEVMKTTTGAILQYVTNRDIILEALKKNPHAVRFTRNFTMNDREIVLLVISECGYILEWIDDTMKDDRQIVSLAVSNHGGSIRWASDRLKNDHQIVLLAVQNDGHALAFVSPELKDNVEIVLCAVSQKRSRALKFASERLKDDRHVALTAIKFDALSFRILSSRLQNDPEVVMTFVQYVGSIVGFSTLSMKLMESFHDNLESASEFEKYN